MQTQLVGRICYASDVTNCRFDDSSTFFNLNGPFDLTIVFKLQDCSYATELPKHRKESRMKVGITVIRPESRTWPAQPGPPSTAAERDAMRYPGRINLNQLTLHRDHHD